MKKTLILAVILALMFSLVSMSGCGGTEADSAAAGNAESTKTQADAITLANYLDRNYSSEGYQIGLMVPSLNSEMLANMSKEVSDFYAGYGITCKAMEAGSDADQIDCINNFTTMGMDLILAVVSNTESVQNAAENARAAGVKFFSLSAVPEYEIDGYIDMDLATMGEITADMAIAWLDKAFPNAEDGSVNAAVLIFTSISDTAAKSNAIIEGLESDPRISIVFTKETDGITKATDAMYEALTECPDLNIVCTFDDAGAMGANAAWLAQSNVDYETAAIFSGGFSESMAGYINAAGTETSLIRGAVLQGGPEQNHWYGVYGLQVLLGLNESPAFYLPMAAMNSFGYVTEIG